VRDASWHLTLPLIVLTILPLASPKSTTYTVSMLPGHLALPLIVLAILPLASPKIVVDLGGSGRPYDGIGGLSGGGA
jgi:hypothetical protein